MDLRELQKREIILTRRCPDLVVDSKIIENLLRDW
jgi:hypothetical protein